MGTKKLKLLDKVILDNLNPDFFFKNDAEAEVFDLLHSFHFVPFYDFKERKKNILFISGTLDESDRAFIKKRYDELDYPKAVIFLGEDNASSFTFPFKIFFSSVPSYEEFKNKFLTSFGGAL